MEKRPVKNPEREERLHMEIIVDANGSDEQVMGWYYHLADGIDFPFSATCLTELETSPLEKDQVVEVLEMAQFDDCETEMFVKIGWKKRTLAVPLGQLMPVPSTDEASKEAIADWHYWLEQGYEF